MESVNKIRIGIIGAGNIGGVHIRRVFEAGRCSAKLRRLRMRICLWRKQERKSIGIAHVAATPEELIQSANVDAVIIGVPNQYHASLAVQAIEAGKHVLIEKPMGINAAAAKQIYEASQASDKSRHDRSPNALGIRPYADQGAGRSAASSAKFIQPKPAGSAAKAFRVGELGLRKWMSPAAAR